MTRGFDSEVSEDRFSRLRLISWWDQEKIAKCRLLVVGAGALGNEILKNAALLGFTQVVVVDIDRIEESNLSRAVLYRSGDVGKFKAEAAARAYGSLAPDARVQPVVANVVHGCGLGLFEWSDVIVAGLDNREARYGSIARRGRLIARGLMGRSKGSMVWCGYFSRGSLLATNARW